MKILLGLSLVTASLLAPGHALAKSGAPAEPVESVLTMPVEGRIVIEKDGSVGGYSLDTKLLEGTSKALDQAIRGWRFEPVLVDGALVRAEARMRISLVATQVGENYQVRVENLVFPADESAKAEAPRSESGRVGFVARKFNPPRYPGAMERAGVSGRVLLGLRFAPDGKVQDVVAVQTMLLDVKGREAILRSAVRQFEESALKAARGWTATVQYAPGTQPGAKELTALTTVEYVMGAAVPAEPVGKWRTIVRTPRRAMPWLEGEKDFQDIGVADIRRGEILPITGAPRLVSPLNTAL